MALVFHQKVRNCIVKNFFKNKIMKTKTVFLDLGGVVFNSTGQSNDKIDWTVITQLNHKYSYQLNIGEDVFKDFMKDYNQLMQQEISGELFLKLLFDTLEFNQELIDILSVDHRIIIVSDNYKENIEYISQRYNFSEWADEQYYSFDFRMEKSNPSFFEDLLKQVKVNIDHLIYIDDSPHKLQSAK